MTDAVFNKINAPLLQDTRLGGYAGILSARFFEERIFSEEAYNGIFKEAEDAAKKHCDIFTENK